MSNEKVTADNLNSVMEFGHVIRVSSDGTVTDSPESPYMEASQTQGDDGRWHEETSLPDGWSLMRGYSGQHGYSGPYMHSSEYIGGGMARHILETPGDYVALVVSTLCNYGEDTDCTEESGCECEPDSWAVAFKPLEDEA